MIDTSWHEVLRNVPGFSLPVLASAGLESRASSIAERVVKAHRFLSKTLEFEPPSAVLVLSIADWPSRSGAQVYGMPHFRPGNLIVAEIGRASCRERVEREEVVGNVEEKK